MVVGGQLIPRKRAYHVSDSRVVVHNTYSRGSPSKAVACYKDQRDRLTGGTRLVLSALYVQFPSNDKRFYRLISGYRLIWGYRTIGGSLP